MDQAYTDKNLVTAPAWPAHPAWLAALLKVLGTEIRLQLVHLKLREAKPSKRDLPHGHLEFSPYKGGRDLVCSILDIFYSFS